MKKRWVSCVVVAAGAVGCSQSAPEDELGLGRADEPILRAEEVPEGATALTGVVGLLRVDDREEHELTPGNWVWQFGGNATLLAHSGQRWMLTNSHLVERNAAWSGSSCVEAYTEPVTNDLDSLRVYVGGYRASRAHPPEPGDQVEGYAEHGVTQAIPFPEVDRMMRQSGCEDVVDVALVRSDAPVSTTVAGHDIFEGDSNDLAGQSCEAFSFGPFVWVEPDARPPGQDDWYTMQRSSGTLRHAEFPILGVLPNVKGRHTGSMWTIDTRSLFTDTVPKVGDSGHPCFRQNRLVGLLSWFSVTAPDFDDAVKNYQKTEVFRDWVRTILFETGSRDVTGDEQADVAVADTVTGDLDIWSVTRPKNEPDALTPGEAESPTGEPHWVYGAGWTPRGIGDFDENRRGDFVYQAIGVGGGWDEGLVYVLSLLAPGVSDWEVIRPPYDLSYELQAVADLDADGISDLIWRNPTNGKNYYWTIAPFDHNRPPEQAVKASKSFQVLAGADWRIVAVADFDRYEILTEPPEFEGALATRSTPDVLWQNTSTGELRLWLMDWWYGTYGRRLSVTLSPPAPMSEWSSDWQVVAVGDYNLDGHTDLLPYCQTCSAGDAVQVWTRKAPDAATDTSRPQFEFVQTCEGWLSYRSRQHPSRVPSEDRSYLPGRCNPDPSTGEYEAYDCFDADLNDVDATEGVASCSPFPTLPAGWHPVSAI